MASGALSRAIIWRRLAAVKRRLGRFQREPGRPGPSDIGDGVGHPDAASGLLPIVVDYFGRDGSTTMLKLLSSSSEIVVEGSYPFELQHVSDALASADPKTAWAAYSSRVTAAGNRGARYYAEKMIDARAKAADLLPMRMIVMLRDPRDTYVSIEAFSRAVGHDDIGGAGSEAARLERFIERQRQRLGWIAGLIESERTMVVRYEPMATDLTGTAARVAEWLGLELDPRVVSKDFRLRWVHGTSPDPRRSVGRWRGELSDDVAERLERSLAEPMEALGYGDWRTP
jgi:Sulfotransferase family